MARRPGGVEQDRAGAGRPLIDRQQVIRRRLIALRRGAQFPSPPFRGRGGARREALEGEVVAVRTAGVSPACGRDGRGPQIGALQSPTHPSLSAPRGGEGVDLAVVGNLCQGLSQ